MDIITKFHFLFSRNTCFNVSGYTWNIKNQITTAVRPFTQLFINAYKSEIKKSVISQIYKNLHDISNHSAKYIKERWGGGGGGLVIIEEEWQYLYGQILLIFTIEGIDV